MQLIKIKGYEMIHSMWSKPYKGNDIVILSFMEKNPEIGKESSGNCSLVLEGKAQFQHNTGSGSFTPYAISIVPKEFSVATDEEAGIMDKYLDEHNLSFENRGGYYHLCYKSMDDMRIRIKDELILFKDLKEFGDDMKVILSWDNGYSYSGSETRPANNVFKFVRNIFSTDKNGENGRASCGKHYGWKFNYDCELVMNITKEDVHYSEVSFS